VTSSAPAMAGKTKSRKGLTQRTRDIPDPVQIIEGSRQRKCTFWAQFSNAKSGQDTPPPDKLSSKPALSPVTELPEEKDMCVGTGSSVVCLPIMSTFLTGYVTFIYYLWIT
jgi:hypothetical protein